MSEINIECGEVVDISAVADLYQRLDAALEQEGSIGLNAGAIERVDAAALQLFACFIQEVKKRNRDVYWMAPTEALLRSARLLGMKPVLLLADEN